MLNLRIKRRAARTVRALNRLSAAAAAAVALEDDDLLDLTEIFTAVDPTPRRRAAAAEMRRCDLRL